MSKRIDHAVGVCEELYGQIVDRLSVQDSIAADEVHEMFQEACQRVADRDGIGVSTVKSQMTRELGLNADKLYELLMDHMVCEDRRVSKLSSVICQHSCRDDDLHEIKRRLLFT